MREDDDYILNYAALLVCIIAEWPTERAIKYITQQELVVPKSIKRVQNAKRISVKRKSATRVTDTFTNEEMIFESASDAARYLGIPKSAVPNYRNAGRIYKGRYKFERVEESLQGG